MHCGCIAIAGAAAGMVATITCFPLDVLRTRMMSPHHPLGLLPTVRRMLAVEGPGAFYTGCLPALVSMAMGGAVFYGTYDWLKSGALRRRGLDPCALLLGCLDAMDPVCSMLWLAERSGSRACCMTNRLQSLPLSGWMLKY